MASSIAFLLILLVIVGVVSLILGVRQRLPARIAFRNVRRGRRRTALLVLGLLVATTIISGSLVIGDTIDEVSVHFTYLALGHTDEAVYNATVGGGYGMFPYSVFQAINASDGRAANVAGIVPEIVVTGQALDLRTHVPQTGLNILGADANQSGSLGSFVSDSGATLAGPGAGQVYLDDQAASDVNASVGDSLRLYGPAVVVATVAAIVHDDYRGDFLGGGNVFTDLATAQQLENASGYVNFLAVANTGSVMSAVAASTSVSNALNQTIAGIHPNYGIASWSIMQSALDSAVSSGSSLVSLFLVLGLFSIVAGSILIVGIFVMLAEERKGEMGMLRAIGLKRRHLVYMYYFEGLVYSAGSAAAGTLLGIGVGYGLTYAFSIDFSTNNVSAQAILQSFTVTTSSLVVSYVVGFILTLATVLLASYWASRLNIVRAIRSVPEPPPPLRTYSMLAYFGVALVVLGGLGLDATARGTGDVTPPLVAGAVLILGIGLILSRFLRNRYAFTISGVGLILWGGLGQYRQLILGTGHTGSITSLFVLGILLIGGAIMVYVFNSDLVVRGLLALTGQRGQRAAVVRVGLSYPGRRAFRTAINLTIFSLVLFTIVAVASFGSSLNSNLGSEVQAQSGGYTLFGASQNSIPDLPALIANNSTLAPLYSHVVSFVSGGIVLNYSDAGGAFDYGLFAAPSNVSPADNFYATNGYNFTSTLHGMSTAAVFQQLETNSSVAVVDGSFQPATINVGSTGPPALSVGQSITVLNPLNGQTRSLVVIGVLAEQFVSGVFVAPATAASLGFTQVTAFLLTVAPGQDATFAEQSTKAAFFAYGLLLFDFAQILQKSIQNTEAVVGLLEIFVALGLAVGIAAMGIVALRAVTERRSEIGMLRAAGFTRGMVVRAFMLEYSYVALLGIGIGTTLAIVLLFNASSQSGGLLSFSVPWVNVGTVVLVAYVLTVLATLGPSLKAARLPPAEAVRYSE